MTFATVTTPGGNEARIWCRPDTNDRMTVEQDIEQDRYGIAGLPKRGGLYIDVGAHIGTWLIAALLDDPAATGIAVEPLPANEAAIKENLEANGLVDRIDGDRLVVPRAFSREREDVRIPWDFASESDPERARMHRYIGGFSLALMPPDVKYREVRVRTILPESLLRGRDVAVLKVAGETSERALFGADLSRVDYLIGKYHAKLPGLVPWLRRTHDVQVEGTEDFGWYRASRHDGVGMGRLEVVERHILG